MPYTIRIAFPDRASTKGQSDSYEAHSYRNSNTRLISSVEGGGGRCLFWRGADAAAAARAPRRRGRDQQREVEG